MNTQSAELIWLVARREIRDRARAKSFWVASVILLLAVAAAVIIPTFTHGGRATARVGIVGGQVAALTQTVKEAGRVSGTTVTVVRLPGVAAARAKLLSGNLAAVLVGDSEVLVKQQPVAGGSSPGTSPLSALSEIAGLQRLYALLPPSAAAGIASHGIALPVRGLLAPPRGLASRITGLAAAILIYVIILTYGVRITIGVGEEKASRVVEVLLTTLRPVQLLAGKVIGMGLLAVAQIVAMVALFLVLGNALGSTAVQGASASVVLAGGLWLLLGYAFYCTAYAAAGSLITRQADAYNASLPLQLPLILAYVLAYTVLYASGVNWFYRVLAFVPFTAPVAMPVLVAVGAAPAWQLTLSAAISIAATVGMARLAGTIYERAILRTGTRLRLRQVLRSPR
jgi:ABC-2 type transport system permease protein